MAGATWAASTELEVAGVSALVTRVLQEVAPSAIAVICLNAAQAQAITRALSDLAQMRLRCALNPKP